MRILIAEDDATSRRLLESMLKKWGYEVVVTCDGDEAWIALEAEDAPRLAVLDWMMPGMDGVELCRLIRRRHALSPPYIIFLTVKDRKEDIIAGLEAGGNDYVTKPFDGDELRARIEVGWRVIGLQSALAGKVKQLEEALAHVKILQGLLPICMHCHKIRDDRDTWQRLEEYISEHSEADFSHSICPECFAKYYSEEGPQASG